MSLWDDYKVDAQFTMDFPHGVNNDEWRTREGKVLKVKRWSLWTAISSPYLEVRNDGLGKFWNFSGRYRVRSYLVREVLELFKKVLCKRI